MTRRTGIAIVAIVGTLAVAAGGVVAYAAGTWFLPTYSGAFCGDYPNDPRCEPIRRAIYQPDLLAGAATTAGVILMAGLVALVWYAGARSRAG